MDALISALTECCKDCLVSARLFLVLLCVPLSGENYVQQVAVGPDDSDAEILRKAASIVPSARQMDYHEREFLCFIHFGPNTFTAREWGSGQEDPKVFAPTQVDTDQWCELIRAAGMTKVVITVKHHDGYCTWQTRYNKDFSVRQSPWKDGQGDVLRRLAGSCKKYGLKLGVYLSPADLYQIESENGLYGNSSKVRKTVIPTDPRSFTSDPTKVRRDKASSHPTFNFEVDDYNRYMLNQLYEVLTEYGPIHEVWFDGAHPKRKGNQQYDKAAWFQLIRELAPEAVIFGGPDIRWCGNEAGNTRESEWSVLPLIEGSRVPMSFTRNDLGSDKVLLQRYYGVDGQQKPLRGLAYMISEVDTSIRSGWFWHDDTHQQVRTADAVFDIYERAVGGNATLLLNIPPNRDGRFSERDAAVLREIGRRIKKTYGMNLLKGSNLFSEGLLDGDLDSYWQAAGLSAVRTVTLPRNRRINRFMLQEAISQVGQRVKAHALDAWIDGRWVEVATGTTVGYKRILRFPEVMTDRLRLRIVDSRLPPSIAELGAYFYRRPPTPVTATRSREGLISLSLERPEFNWKGGSPQLEALEIRYTLDGSEPGPDSRLYKGPFALPEGGYLKAGTVSVGQMSEIREFHFGLSSMGWEAFASSEHSQEHAAEKAIDGDRMSFWQSSQRAGHSTHPIELTIDMKEQHPVAGFSYLPRQDRPVPESRVEAWRVEVSRNGENWQALAEGEFGNLVNDPSKRYHWWPESVQIRYFRFVSLRGTGGNPFAGAAEIELFRSTHKD